MIKNNLNNKQLKESFKSNILDALGKRKNAALKITITFSDGSNYKFKNEIIRYFAGSLYYKDTNFPLNASSINIIVNNMHYAEFAPISSEFKKGKTECHGHGEFWGEDKAKYNYYRF